MKRYEFFEHTADVKFRAYGKNAEEQFSNAALALTSVMFNPDKIEEKITKPIKINGNDLKSLLYNFLEELLFLLDTESFITRKVTGIKISEINKKHILTANLVGDKISGKYENIGAVKAVTYNEMEIKKDYAQVVLDV
ncbi:archease [Candidatus Woesearchaeota archaeon]|nr:archease [Candidatus Woesearchaeota archaeon]